MTNIKIQPDTVRQESSRFSQAAADLTNIYWSINRLSNQLDWDVRSKGQVESRINSAASLGKKLYEEASVMSDYLKNCAAQLEQADSQGQSSIGSITPIGVGSTLPVVIGGIVGGGILIGLIGGGGKNITNLPWIKKCILPFVPPGYVAIEPDTPIWPAPGNKMNPKRRFGAYDPNRPGDKNSLVIIDEDGKRKTVSGHAGIDIMGERGDEILAATGGKVVRAGWSTSYGNVVYIDYGSYQVRYAHLDYISDDIKKALVSGEPISANTSIGGMGDTPGPPWCDGVHLHFEVRLSDTGQNCSIGNDDSHPIDPINFLNPGPIVAPQF